MTGCCHVKGWERLRGRLRSSYMSLPVVADVFLAQLARASASLSCNHYRASREANNVKHQTSYFSSCPRPSRVPRGTAETRIPGTATRPGLEHVARREQQKEGVSVLPRQLSTQHEIIEQSRLDPMTCGCPIAAPGFALPGARRGIRRPDLGLEPEKLGRCIFTCQSPSDVDDTRDFWKDDYGRPRPPLIPFLCSMHSLPPLLSAS